MKYLLLETAGKILTIKLVIQYTTFFNSFQKHSQSLDG